jgi:hypothetical protein
MIHNRAEIKLWVTSSYAHDHFPNITHPEKSIRATGAAASDRFIKIRQSSNVVDGDSIVDHDDSVRNMAQGVKKIRAGLFEGMQAIEKREIEGNLRRQGGEIGIRITSEERETLWQPATSNIGEGSTPTRWCRRIFSAVYPY